MTNLKHGAMLGKLWKGKNIKQNRYHRTITEAGLFTSCNITKVLKRLNLLLFKLGELFPPEAQ